MITMTTVDATAGTRLRAGDVVPSARPSGWALLAAVPARHLGVLGGFMIKNNSTGVSEVEYRHQVGVRHPARRTRPRTHTGIRGLFVCACLNTLRRLLC